MIPENISRKNVLEAIEEIDRTGIPNGRTSKEFKLLFKGKLYPPKYVISLANKYANGEELNSSVFSGGNETNSLLERFGFEIIETTSPSSHQSIPMISKKRKPHPRKRHNERCQECKEKIEQMLKIIYGEVVKNYKFEIGAHPEDFKGSTFHSEIRDIFSTLQKYRGYDDFVRASNLPNADFFVPNPGFIVEFDESQHFSACRKESLITYPNNFQIGYDINRWIELCEQINAKDNDPPFRDEQRAWYDSLRDFLPTLKGFQPTVRLFSKDFMWCSLDPNNSSDVVRFSNFLKGGPIGWNIELKVDPNPSLARIIIAGGWEGKLKEARQLLEDVLERWPKGNKVKFLVTCGGFIRFDWPNFITRKEIGDNKNPSRDSVEALVEQAEKCAKSVLGKGLDEKLREVTDYITLGIDSYKEKISTTQNYINRLHIELVFLVDLINNRYHWVGKSYPTSRQQNSLVRISNLKTHFIELDDIGKTMILGCHDLTIFNPRSSNAKGWRRRINDDFRRLTGEEKPIIVLAHPHTTVKRKTWLNSWNYIRRTLPSVKQYASAGIYYEPDRDPSNYDALDYVLKSTKWGEILDFIVHIKE